MGSVYVCKALSYCIQNIMLIIVNENVPKTLNTKLKHAIILILMYNTVSLPTYAQAALIPSLTSPRHKERSGLINAN